MTHIGAVTVKCQDGVAPTHYEIVTEDGEHRVAEFRYERPLCLDFMPLMPGNIYMITHHRYVRVA